VRRGILNLYCRSGSGDLDEFDSLLCDLFSLKEELDKGQGINLQWSFHQSGYTGLTKNIYRIYWDGTANNPITIEKVEELFHVRY
jgi:hypothetical protein